MDTQSYIKDQLRAKMNRVRPAHHAPVVAAQAAVIPAEERSGFLGKFLGICILLMSIAIVMAGVAKATGFEFNVGQRNTTKVSHRPVAATPEPKVIERPIHNPDYVRRSELTSVQSELAALQKSHDTWKHRIWLLAVASNENSNLSRKIDRQYHGNVDSGFITFDEQWKMNRMPQTMDLSQEQRDMLRNDIK